MVALVAALDDRRASGVKAQHDLDDTSLKDASSVETRVVEDAQHRRVPRQHLGNELVDSRSGRVRRQALEQSCPDAPSVQIISDGERNLRATRVVQAHVRRECDRVQRSALVDQLADQRTTRRPIGFERS